MDSALIQKRGKVFIFYLEFARENKRKINKFRQCLVLLYRPFKLQKEKPQFLAACLRNNLITFSFLSRGL